MFTIPLSLLVRFHGAIIACNLFNRLVKGYACKSGYCVSNRSSTNCKVYGALGGKANANRKV